MGGNSVGGGSTDGSTDPTNLLLDPEALKFLVAGAKTSGTLTTLELGGTYIRDEGCASLANLLDQNISLRHVGLSDCAIGDTGFR